MSTDKKCEMFRVVQIRVREAGRIHYYKVGEHNPVVGDRWIVETERGQDYGEVISEPEMIMEAEAQELLRGVVRKITSEDEEKINKNKEEARKAETVFMEKSEAHKLPMKLIYVEYSFDQHKLVFYFSAEGRIDFRDLVKDLAGVFKARIELRQIGVRDEAKILGGLGCCGRPLCCATFLRDFVPVNIKMAKNQRLPLNPDKISGVCGRLLCCLKYEDDVYRKCAREIPIEGTRVATDQGEGVVKDINILKQTVRVDLGEDRLVVFLAKDVKVISQCPQNCLNANDDDSSDQENPNKQGTEEIKQGNKNGRDKQKNQNRQNQQRNQNK